MTFSAAGERTQGLRSELYNDVLERLLGVGNETDVDDGFGMLSDEDADRIREQREEAKEKRTERMRRLGEES